MRDPVNRTYDATRRRQRSAATRQRILDATRTLLIERGYRRTTVTAVADRAGVSVDTVYELVGRKPTLLRELIEQAISGTDHAVPPLSRRYVKDIRAEPDPAEKLRRYAAAVREIQQRMAPLALALRDAAQTDAEARQVWDEINERRATNMRKLVRDVRSAGSLRDGLTVAAAADVIWATAGAELYVLLTVDRGWSPGRYERWLADMWCRTLLSSA